MCGISKKIELVRRYDKQWKEIPISNESAKTAAYHNFEMVCEDAIFPIIAELETANKRIAELEKDNERLQKALDKADPQGIYDDKKTTGGG